MSEDKNWQVTRFCCRSGMCLECRAVANGTQRKRIVHANYISRELALRMEEGWASYDAKAERMPAPVQQVSHA